MSFLRAGVPLSKVNSFRDLLEENVYSLPDRQYLSEAISFRRKVPNQREISGKLLSVIFDGTTHVKEALAVVL